MRCDIEEHSTRSLIKRENQRLTRSKVSLKEGRYAALWKIGEKKNHNRSKKRSRMASACRKKTSSILMATPTTFNRGSGRDGMIHDEMHICAQADQTLNEEGPAIQETLFSS